MNPLERLTLALHTAVERSLNQSDTDFVAARIQTAILLRTSRGEFLDGSGGTTKPQYRSESHKKKRAKLGLPIDRVTLFMGRVGVLEAMRARGVITPGGARIQIGYLAGLSEERAAEIAGYLDRQGAGKNKITFPFLGLTAAEERQVTAALAARVGANLQAHLNL